MRTILITAAALCLTGCSKKSGQESVPVISDTLSVTSNTLTDARDGKKYRTVTIGNQRWMAENLNHAPQTGNSWCHDTSYCDEHGRMYDWKTAMSVCPDGWHLPTSLEWDVLALFVGGERRPYKSGAIDWYGAGKKLKAKSGWAWNSDDNVTGNGTDDHGFSAEPNGVRLSNGKFAIAGFYGFWWTATEDQDGDARARLRGLDYNNDYMRTGINNKDFGLFARCLHGEPPDSAEQKRAEEKRQKEEEALIEKATTYFTDLRDGKKYRAVKINGRTWMAENLNYKTGKSWCYKNSDSNCVKYGRLYDFHTAKSVCLSGWHLPSREEWDSLAQSVGGERLSDEDNIAWDGAGVTLKAKNGWGGGGNGTDYYGFSALPGGSRETDGSFGDAGYGGLWWTATEHGGRNAYYLGMGYDFDYVGEDIIDKNSGYSVRCVKE